MQNVFVQEGNLGKDPELILVPKQGEESVKKLKLSVRFPYAIKQGDGSYEDTKGFWATVEMWGRQADSLHRLLKKGARVLVMGTIQDNSFVAKKGDREGQTIPGMLVNAQNIALSPLGIESIVYAQKETEGESQASASMSAPNTDAAAEDMDEEIPFNE